MKKIPNLEKDITFAEIKKLYRFEDLKDKGFNINDVRLLASRMQEGDIILVYENLNFDSSAFGDANLVLAGPTRTFSAENPPERYGELASRIMCLVGELDVEDIKDNI